MNYAEIKKTYYSKLEEESTSSFPGFEAWMESCSTFEESLEVFKRAINASYPNTSYPSNIGQEKVGNINCVYLREKPLSFLKIALNKTSTMDDFEQVWEDFREFSGPDSFNKIDESADEINYITLCSKTLSYAKTTEDVFRFWHNQSENAEVQLMILTKFLSLAETSEEIWKLCEYMVSGNGDLRSWMEEIKLCFRKAFELEDKKHSK